MIPEAAGRMALHPQTQELARQVPCPRGALQAVWRASVPGCRHPLGLQFFGEVPLVGSAALIAALDTRVAGLVADLKPWLTPAPDPQWPHLAPPDVLAVDVAIVASEEEPGWALRWVEFQAFTSALATLVLLRRAHAACWPALAHQRPFGPSLTPDDDGIAAIGRVVVPGGAGAIVEHHPWRQSTRFDIEATSRLWHLPVLGLDRLRVRQQWFEGQVGRAWIPLDHLVNRTIVHRTPDPARWQATLSAGRATWHSHPAWFCRIDKGLLTALPLPPVERCVDASRWEELGLPAERLVAKARHSFGGQDVLLHLDAARLRALPDPKNWVVQPRYQPLALTRARDGAPLFGEVRCMVALPAQGQPWLMGRIVRLSRGQKVSMSTVRGAPGEGATLLYDPPEGMPDPL